MQGMTYYVLVSPSGQFLRFGISGSVYFVQELADATTFPDAEKAREYQARIKEVEGWDIVIGKIEIKLSFVK